LRKKHISQKTNGRKLKSQGRAKYFYFPLFSLIHRKQFSKRPKAIPLRILLEDRETDTP
jgi:hypothetical protein